MAFVKLDTEILDSTIWIDRPAREVFITSLLLAHPREFTEPLKQISVGSLEFTGWEAPPDWYGYVPASGPGIVHRAQLPMAEGTDALRRLCSPEPESRSQAFEGRRMIRIDGGYVILNYMKYRDKDHSSSVRSARYRARLRASAEEESRVTASRHAVTSHTRDMLSASASELCIKSDPDPKSRRRAKCQLPEDFAPNARHQTIADEQGVDLAQQFAEFTDHWLAKGELRANWDATLRNWLRRAKRFGAPSKDQQTASELKYQFRQDWTPTKAHGEAGDKLGLTKAEVWARADDCKRKPIKQGFVDEDAHFFRELTWAKRDKDAQKAKEASYGIRKDFETPGHDRKR